MAWESFTRDLAEFATQLLNIDSTRRSGEVLLSMQGAFENSWRTRRVVKSDAPIPIPPPRDKGLHPHNCKVVGAELLFSFSRNGIADDAELPTVAEFQVRVTGSADYNHCMVDLEDHWRVDTHNFSGDPREPHPLIHFQRGGHAQDAWAGKSNFVPGPDLPEKDDFWLSLLQSPGPRIPFPPFCPILAVDFVIGQHDGDIWNRLRYVPEYRALVAAAQDRVWTPFFEALRNNATRRKWLGPMLLE
jgi:hypothetical protein